MPTGRIALTLAICAAATAARAQSPGCEAANQRFTDTLKLIAQLDPAEALDRFNRVQTDCPQPRVLAQVALAEARLGRWPEAHRHLSEALTSRGDPSIEEKRPEFTRALDLIAKHLPPVHAVAEKPVNPEAPPPISVKPPEPSMPLTPPESPNRARRNLAYAGYGVAALFLTGGVISAAYRNPVVDHWNYGCLVPLNMTRAMNCDDGRDVKLTEAGMITGFGVAGLLAIGSTLLLVLPEKEQRRSNTVSVNCGAGPGVVGVTCGGSF